VTGQRRLSQAISEGDGISLLVPAVDLEAVRRAEDDGAEGVVVESDLAGIREVTGLPILWRGQTSPAEAMNQGADACLVTARQLEDDAAHVERRYSEASDLGLECVVRVMDGDELEAALERFDPEIFLLSPGGNAEGDVALEQVLDLLPDVPAGKLAIADLRVTTREEVAELERAGVDAVIVGTSDVAGLVSAAPPEV
jgi:indole-3-glycerol phosphate synthase